MFVEGLKLNAAADDAIKLDGKKDEMRGAPVSVGTIWMTEQGEYTSKQCETKKFWRIPRCFFVVEFFCKLAIFCLPNSFL